MKVPPPKQAKDSKGEMVPYETLPPAEQAEAWAQYRNDVVAAHIGARTQVQTAFRKGGASPGLARALSEASFGKANPEAVFQAVLESGERDSLTPKARQKLVSKMPNDQLKAVATRYLQGQDYLDVRSEFMDPNSSKAVSEYSSVKEIKSGLAMGSAMLEERAKGYPEEFRDPSMTSQFRARVLRRLEALNPQKAVAVQKAVDEMDADDYDKASKKWGETAWKAEAEILKRTKQREKIEAEFQKEYDAAQGGYRDAPKPVKSMADRLKERKLDPKDDPVTPPMPQQPARYDLVRKNIPEAKEQHSGLLEQGTEPKAPPKSTKTASVDIAARVVGRFLAFSSCAL